MIPDDHLPTRDEIAQMADETQETDEERGPVRRPLDQVIENEMVHPPNHELECPVCDSPYQGKLSGIRLPELDEEHIIDLRGVARVCTTTTPPDHDRSGTADGAWSFYHTRQDLDSDPK